MRNVSKQMRDLLMANNKTREELEMETETLAVVIAFAAYFVGSFSGWCLRGAIEQQDTLRALGMMAVSLEKEMRVLKQQQEEEKQG